MIVQHYTFRCDAPGCSVEATEITPLPVELAEFAPPRPTLPKGWTRLNEDVLCPAHVVAYT